MKEQETSDVLRLTRKERLLRHNLETRQYWTEKNVVSDGEVHDDAGHTGADPQSWILTKDIALYDWQEECVEKWLEQKRGTIKVVTGAGKTILALAIIERLQAVDPQLRVAIVVPTIVLQEQWYKEILSRSNLPARMIGRLGGGYNEGFSEGRKILLCVLKSASVQLSSKAAKGGVERNLLLIADECHKAGAPDMSKVFVTKRAYNLGLSATPERDDELESGLGENSSEYDAGLLGQELGPIIFELSVQQAFKQGILPEFEIHHYGLPLVDSERERYDSLSRRLRDVSSELRELGHRYGFHDANITSRTQILAKREDQLGLVARQHIALTTQRKRLLYDAQLRSCAALVILRKEFQENPNTRAMLFHESIENVMLLYHELLQEDFPVAVEHSGLTTSLREESIGLFRQGIAQVIVSVKSLVEGFNVPETDIGIVVASSTSVRQRIQTIGRLLRKKQGGATATIYVLYMHDTVDEIIYEKADWDNLLGAERNRYFLWQEDGTVIEQEQAPRFPLPTDQDLPLEVLEAGDEYPGAYEGVEYTSDSDGNVFTNDGALVANPQDVPEQIRKVKGSYGRFKVTPKRRYILVKAYEEPGRLTKFVEQLEDPFEIVEYSEEQAEDLDVGKLKTGDTFPRELVGGQYQVIHYKQRRGRYVLAKKEGRGERYARVGTSASDPKKGADAEGLMEACKELKAKNPQMNKLIVTDSQHVLSLKDGNYLYLYTLEAGLEFP